MTFSDLADAIVRAAKLENMRVTETTSGLRAVYSDSGYNMGVVPSACDISLYFGDKAGRLCIRRFTDLDDALSAALDWIYA